MWEPIAADAVVLIHVAFIVFVVAGGFVAIRWRGVAWLHIPAVVWGALIEFMGWICPLTPLENRLRLAAGEQGYAKGFIQHYLIPIVYPTGLSRDGQLGLGVAVVVVNVIIYTLIVRRWSAIRRRSKSGPEQVGRKRMQQKMGH